MIKIYQNPEMEYAVSQLSRIALLKKLQRNLDQIEKEQGKIKHVNFNGHKDQKINRRTNSN